MSTEADNVGVGEESRIFVDADWDDENVDPKGIFGTDAAGDFMEKNSGSELTSENDDHDTHVFVAVLEFDVEEEDEIGIREPARSGDLAHDSYVSVDL
ncbi:hypothetical protein VKT23_010649 [Stygiomarasmius scandens]|uniref:Uncharacterized protein n=1 Tax=Marasmiellus scandens TaxID=2682957 RepID=A0ABR1JBJ6_9AGAR